ncbi:short repeat uncharacterized protein DUF308 [Paenibacillus cellulosilyticus]|uniref:Short repeat uncharacterized protein DUF308 n=1 Tax=Paenibacillus cellulosilyticus TaxID=375489 RepID=A0A2V2YEE6_9BACL|nr:YtpI family protein [Paenibacillus cellulosilyticus]PWV90559.1 short repeat uncharacterized protein DUF308 [Paenibacillus cellulosilyticus]QKS46765.1 DUF308 domain-containing protein [Paenibacillus cellulosilyticus]
MYILHWLLTIAVIVSSVVSVVYSFKSRRSTDPLVRGLYAARMNISMGAMLIMIALFQMLAFSGSTLKVVIGAVLLVLGVFNIFAGLRNQSTYRQLVKRG